MFGKVLNLAGGPSFVAACSQHRNIGTGNIAITVGGNLACNYVIHAVCCDWSAGRYGEQVLRGLLEKIFRTCHQTSARSLAMPLIGTGKHEFPEDVLLRLMKEEIESFSAIYPRSTLKEIKLVRYDKGRGYDKYTKRESTVRSSKQPTFVQLCAGGSDKNVTLEVYGRSSQDIAAAFYEVDRFIKNHIQSRQVEYEKLYDVVLKHWEALIKEISKQ